MPVTRKGDDIPYTGLSLIHGNALVVTLMPALWGVVQHAVFSRWLTLWASVSNCCGESARRWTIMESGELAMRSAMFACASSGGE